MMHGFPVGIAIGECDWSKGATDNVRSLRRRGSVFEQEHEKNEVLREADAECDVPTGTEHEKPLGFEVRAKRA